MPTMEYFSVLMVLLLSRCALVVYSESADFPCSRLDLDCPGDRPKNDLGCCPLLAGNACTKNTTTQMCDQELGLTCIDAVCKGKICFLFVACRTYVFR